VGLKKINKLRDLLVAITFFGALLLTGSFAWAAVDSSAESQQSLEMQWALQVGYFSNLQNALDLKEQLIESGFDIQVVSTGAPGEQEFRVIGGWADSPEELDTLRNEFEDATGDRGYLVQNPYLENQQQVAEENSDDPIEQPRTRYLLAQAGNAQPTGGEGMGSSGISRNNPGVFRTPQEEMDSIPGFTAAGLNIIPTLGLSVGYDDNITRANIEEIDSFFYMISPAIRVELPSDRSILAMTAAADVIRYTDSKIDNSDNWYVRGDWAWDPSTRQDFNLFAQYGEGTDARGTGRRQGDNGLLPFDPDDWKRFDYGGIWRYGAVGARGKLDVVAGATDLEYTNNRDRTYLLDRDWYYVGGTFYWRVAPKTSALAQVIYTDIDYDVADSDSEETSWLLGMTWEASARTSGTIRYGNQKKKFDNPELEDYNGPTWIAAASWRPRTYSMFTLTTTRRTQEPDGDGDYVLRKDISLAWVHDWASRFGTVVEVGYGEDDYRPDGRTDDLFYWSVGGRYMFNPHFRFGASIQGYDRDSDIEEYDYKRHIYMLTLEASF
jgi:hypothetical protein